MDHRAGHPRNHYERRRDPSAPPPSGQPDRRQPALAVIHWKNTDGSESEGHPLPRLHAEALLRAFQSYFPRPSFWLDSPPALAAARIPPPVPGEA